MDTKLISKLKEVNLLTINDPICISIIQQKLEEFRDFDGEGGTFAKNIYFWMKYSIMYNCLKKEEQEIVSKLTKKNSEINKKILEIKNSYDFHQAKENLFIFETKKNELTILHKQI